ncbi:MAG TPA: hypothetical protein PK765_01565 [bacterium]|nr:hypothetical protein [bacterium]
MLSSKKSKSEKAYHATDDIQNGYKGQEVDEKYPEKRDIDCEEVGDGEEDVGHIEKKRGRTLPQELSG